MEHREDHIQSHPSIPHSLRYPQAWRRGSEVRFPPSCICQVTRVWCTDQNSGRPPFYSKRGKRTQHDKRRDGQMVMIDTLGEHAPDDCSPSLASILIAMWIVNIS